MLRNVQMPHCRDGSVLTHMGHQSHVVQALFHWMHTRTFAMRRGTQHTNAHSSVLTQPFVRMWWQLWEGRDLTQSFSLTL